MAYTKENLSLTDILMDYEVYSEEGFLVLVETTGQQTKTKRPTLVVLDKQLENLKEDLKCDIYSGLFCEDGVVGIIGVVDFGFRKYFFDVNVKDSVNTELVELLIKSETITLINYNARAEIGKSYQIKNSLSYISKLLRHYSKDAIWTKEDFMEFRVKALMKFNNSEEEFVNYLREQEKLKRGK